jgi:hypothetical protein
MAAASMDRLPRHKPTTLFLVGSHLSHEIQHRVLWSSWLPALAHSANRRPGVCLRLYTFKQRLVRDAELPSTASHVTSTGQSSACSRRVRAWLLGSHETLSLNVCSAKPSV